MDNKRIACFIPIKKNSERVKSKNFKILNGIPLYQYIIEHAIESGLFTDIYVDTDSEEICEFINNHFFKRIIHIPRTKELTYNSANGNDLLNYHYYLYPNYDYYFQLFATAPFLKSSSIRECVNLLIDNDTNDSILTVLEKTGWYWVNGQPVNYRPSILPRSQDALKVIQESTGLYGITKASLKKYRCRIGAKPYFYFIDEYEAVDLDNEFDFEIAEIIGAKYNEH